MNIDYDIANDYDVTELDNATLFVNKADDADAWVQFSEEIQSALSTGADCYEVIGTNAYDRWAEEIGAKTGRPARLIDWDAPSEPYTSAKVVWLDREVDEQ